MKAITKIPPKGFNSYDGFGWSVNEEEFKQNVEFCDKYLKQYGYNYMVVDFCWSHPGYDNRNNPHQTNDLCPCLCMDNFGRLLPSPDRFPSSTLGRDFLPISKYVRGKGMKFGIHLMRGIPKQAVQMNVPIKGTNYFAKDVALDGGIVCGWLNHMLPLNMEHPAAQAYLDSIFELYSAWEVDFVKVDDIGFPYHKMEIEGYAKAIEKCNREIVISISPGATLVEEWKHVSEFTNMWRISKDFWDEYKQLLKNFELFDSWSKVRVENTYPDGDMLPFSKLAIRGPIGEERYSNFTFDEKISLLTMWSINNSPLMLGGNLPEIDEETLKLLTNSDMLHIDNYATNARKLSDNDKELIWIADDKYNEELKYLAIFNVSDNDIITKSIKLSDFKINAKSVKDIWNDSGFVNANEIVISVRPHSAVLLMIV